MQYQYVGRRKMNHIMRALALTLTTTVAFTTAVSQAPATAASLPTTVARTSYGDPWDPAMARHVRDRGYDRSIVIRCQETGGIHLLRERRSSTRFCKDLGGVFIRAHEILVYRVNGSWHTWESRSGYHTGKWYDVHNGTTGEWALKWGK